jgi:hypothetical protein
VSVKILDPSSECGQQAIRNAAYLKPTTQGDPPPDDTAARLRTARALIADEQDWTRDSYARNRKGKTIAVTRRSARRFCAIGALARAYMTEPANLSPFQDALRILDDATEELFPNMGGVMRVNDLCGHDAVIQIYDLAIVKAES